MFKGSGKNIIMLLDIIYGCVVCCSVCIGYNIWVCGMLYLCIGYNIWVCGMLYLCSGYIMGVWCVVVYVLDIMYGCVVCCSVCIGYNVWVCGVL